jgi:antirestriction protein
MENETMSTRPIGNDEDILDSQEILNRIAELETGDIEEWDTYPGELDALRTFAADGADYSGDWEYGATLIRDSYFQEYAQELAEDIGAVNRDGGWPTYCIDWEWAARELRQDYTAVDFDGVTYWVC